MQPILTVGLEVRDVITIIVGIKKMKHQICLNVKCFILYCTYKLYGIPFVPAERNDNKRAIHAHLMISAT